MSALVVVLGLWALGAVGAAWVVVLSRMLTARRESDQRVYEDRWWESVRVIGSEWVPAVDNIMLWLPKRRFSDTVPMR